MTLSARVYLLLVFASVSLFHPYMMNSAFCATIPISQNEKTWLAQVPVSVEDNGVSLDIDKRGSLILTTANVATVTFDYETDGNFLVTTAAVFSPGDAVDSEFNERKKVWSGKGQLTFDFRRTKGWAPGCRPLLVLEGTGKFRIENLVITTPVNLNDYSKEKASAFFWGPVNIWHTTINFITPVYWDIGKKINFSEFLGIFYLVLVALTILAGLFIKNVRKERVVIWLSLAGVFIFALHFTIRFAPSINFSVIDSNEEKIKRNYYRPEFGIFAAKARETFKPDDVVAVMVENGDWLAREELCFNITPIKCVYWDSENNTMLGIPWGDLPNYVTAEREEINAIAYFNSALPLPDGFKKVFEQNKNVFLARKE